MTPLQLKIIFNAIKIRVSRGEDLEEAINSYSKLSPEEKKYLKSMFPQD